MNIHEVTEEISALVPNCLRHVEGEKSLQERVFPFIEHAWLWATANICPACLADHAPLFPRLVACEAYLRALPSLNVVMTPNGLATVGTQTLVAASSQRTGALMDALGQERDRLLEAVCDSLVGCAPWADFWASRSWGGSLLCLPSFTAPAGRGWERFLETVARASALEMEMQRDWISPELHAALLREALFGTLQGPRLRLVSRLQEMLLDGHLNARALSAIVDDIRKAPSLFPEWQASATADLFTPPTFENDPQASGYFF